MRLIEPLPYVRFMSLVAGAAAVVTDSGGLQEETTYLGIPCFTLRENTERPITISEGTNRLATPADLAGLVDAALAAAGRAAPAAARILGRQDRGPLRRRPEAPVTRHPRRRLTRSAHGTPPPNARKTRFP